MNRNLEHPSAGGAIAAARLDGCAAVRAIAHRLPNHAVNSTWINLRGWILFQTSSFLCVDFINGTALRARNEIPFAEPKQGNKEQDQAPADAGDGCHCFICPAAGKTPAKPTADFPSVAGNGNEEEHFNTS